MKWKILKKQDVSPSKWFPIIKEEVELPSGQRDEYFKSDLPDVAMIVPLTAQHELVFVRQYKHGIGEITLEFPAGRIESGKTVLETAIRELAEETGIAASEKELLALGELWTEPSKSTVRVSGFLITNATVNSQQNLDTTENIEVVTVPLSKIDQLLVNGDIRASDTVALLLMARTKYPLLFK